MSLGGNLLARGASPIYRKFFYGLFKGALQSFKGALQSPEAHLFGRSGALEIANKPPSYGRVQAV